MVTEQDVRHVAALARLAIDDARLPSLVEELNRILEHMDALAKVPDGGRETTPMQAMPLREDGGPPLPLGIPRERFAPELREGFFIVPRLATHESEGEGA